MKSGFPSFEKCVGAIAETMIGQQAPWPSKESGKIVTGFLLETHSKMPDYLRLAFRVLVVVFDMWSYPASGKPFHRLDIARRTRQLDGWEHSRLGSQRTLIVFFRALTTFGLFSEIYKSDCEIEA